MGVHHVQVAFVDRNVGRLADGASGVVQPRIGMGQLHEVLEVFERSIAPTLVQVHDKWRAVSGCKHHIFSADTDVVLGVARMLRELFGRGFQNFPHLARLKAHTQTVDLCASLAKHGQAFIIVPDIQAHLGQDAFRRGFNFLKPLFTQDVVGGYATLDVGRPGYFCIGVAALAPALASTLAHDRILNPLGS